MQDNTRKIIKRILDANFDDNTTDKAIAGLLREDKKNTYPERPATLFDMFGWFNTPEGGDFWCDIYGRIG